ncbi:MAG: hypothetical protein ABSF14_22805 [Terriglobia bacterium]|jgi:hypothetical protein
MLSVAKHLALVRPFHIETQNEILRCAQDDNEGLSGNSMDYSFQLSNIGQQHTSLTLLYVLKGLLFYIVEVWTIEKLWIRTLGGVKEKAVLGDARERMGYVGIVKFSENIKPFSLSSDSIINWRNVVFGNFDMNSKFSLWWHGLRWDIYNTFKPVLVVTCPRFLYQS